MCPKGLATKRSLTSQCIIWCTHDWQAKNLLSVSEHVMCADWNDLQLWSWVGKNRAHLQPAVYQNVILCLISCFSMPLRAINIPHCHGSKRWKGGQTLFINVSALIRLRRACAYTLSRALDLCVPSSFTFMSSLYDEVIKHIIIRGIGSVPHAVSTLQKPLCSIAWKFIMIASWYSAASYINVLCSHLHI